MVGFIGKKCRNIHSRMETSVIRLQEKRKETLATTQADVLMAEEELNPVIDTPNIIERHQEPIKIIEEPVIEQVDVPTIVEEIMEEQAEEPVEDITESQDLDEESEEEASDTEQEQTEEPAPKRKRSRKNKKD